MSKSSQSGWKLYERLIAQVMVNQISTDLCVTPNARVKGKISGRSRQIDALIDSRHDTDNARRIIVDAKKRRRKIDVTHVEAFRGLMEDVGATHGYLICPAGHTAAAERRAQEAITIGLVPLDYLQDFDPLTWPICHNTQCKGGRVFWNGYPEFSVALQPLSDAPSASSEIVRFVHCVGKCDRCFRFHIKCMTQNQIFSLSDEDEHQSCCLPTGFWLSSLELDPLSKQSAELHVVSKNGEVITVDRRSM